MESERLSPASVALAGARCGGGDAWSFLESIAEGFCAFDAEWRFVYLNPAAVRLLGASVENPAQLLGQKFWDLFPTTKGTIVEQEFRRAAGTEFEVFYKPWKRWFAARANPIASGGASVLFRDITAEKHTGVARDGRDGRDGHRRGKDRFEIFHAVEQGFCVLEMIADEQGRDYDYRFVELNPAFERHTGLQNALGRRVTELVPDLEPIWSERYGRVATTGVPARFEERSDVLGRDFSVYAWRIGDPALRRVALLFSDVTERKKTEAELARLSVESRSRIAELETLLDVLPIGIGIAMDRECRRIRLNPSFAEMLGLPPEANASKTAPPEEQPKAFRVLDETGREFEGHELPMQIAAAEGREVRDREVTVVRGDGRRLRLLEYAAPLFDDRGDPRGSVGAFVDITERREAEERHRFLVALDDALRPLDNPAEIVSAAAQLLGEHLGADRCAYADVEADEDTFNLTGNYCRDVPSIVGRYTFTGFGTEVLRLMRANEPYVVEDIETHEPRPESLAAYHGTCIRAVVCVPLHKRGTFVAAMAVHQKTPRRWTPAEVSLVLHVANRCWEAIERIRVTRVLAESEERFRAMADNIPQLAWMADADGSLTWYNRRWLEYTGTTFEQMQGWGWQKVHHADHVARVAEKWREHLASGREWEDTFPLLGADGEYRWFLSRAFPICDTEGKVLRWFGTNTDVTEQREAAEALARAKEQAEAASRAKDDFLAALSHELRTPLTPVLLSAASLQEDERLPEDARAELAVMRRNIELEARLIDDLLDLTGISRGKLALRPQRCDLHGVLGLALEIVRDDAQAKGLTIELQLEATRVRLHCDPARMQQVFWNLLKNAVKFTPAGGRVTVASRDEGDLVRVEITDTGVGIEPAELGRIFLPFEQAESTAHHRFGGLGLGLAISKAIVEMHGGTVHAASAGLGDGATFTILLGAQSTDAEEAMPSENPAEPARGATAVRPMRLLVVEDHAPTLAILERLLARAGHSVSVAGCTAAARELAARESFDAVISDIGLPDGSGIELMRELNAMHGLRGIALSGYGMEEDTRRSRDAGFVAHLVKPVDFAQLRLTLAQFTLVD